MKRIHFVFLIILYGCNPSYECIEKHQANFQSQPLYETIRRQFLDTLQSWEKMRIRTMQQYKETEKWKIDMILMNKKGTHGLIVVIEKDGESHGADLFGIKKDSILHFYSAGFPSFVFDHRGDSREFSDISLLIRESLIEIKPGLFINCEVNDKFIEAFFEEDLQESHKHFLNDIEDNSDSLK